MIIDSSPLTNVIPNVVAPSNITKSTESLGLDVQAAIVKVKLSSNILGHKATERMRGELMALHWRKMRKQINVKKHYINPPNGIC